MENIQTHEEPQMIVSVRRLSEQAVMPVRYQNGFILRSPKPITLPARTARTLVPTDLAFTVPREIVFQMGPVPGIAWHTRYRIVGKFLSFSEKPQVLSVHMFNETGADIQVKANDPIGLLKMLGPITTCHMVEENVPPKNVRPGEYLVGTHTKKSKTK